MKSVLLLVTLLITGNLLFAQTQLEMNQNAQKSFLKAEQQLNAVYGKILKEYKADTVFVKNLKAAQRLWIKLRDAEMLAKYPEREDGYYGSVDPMCWSMYKEELTKERIDRLKIWITGIEEGDVCTGSVKVK